MKPIVLLIISCAYGAINYRTPMSELDLDFSAGYPSQYETSGNAVILS